MSFPFMMNDFERNSKVTREGFEMEFSRECGTDLVGIGEGTFQGSLRGDSIGPWGDFRRI
jgi:hypothetical protein